VEEGASCRVTSMAPHGSAARLRDKACSGRRWQHSEQQLMAGGTARRGVAVVGNRECGELDATLHREQSGAQ
jgi:hypothetical protein